MSFYQRLKSLLPGSGRFNPSSAAKRIPATVIREIAPEDYGACIDIYKQNEANTIPPGYMSEFESDLTSGANLWLGVEEYGDLVAVGGIHLDTEDTWAAALVFGMVRPDRHGKGYGSALLLARIAALPRPDPAIRIVMTSLENSVGFFKRFGFVYVTSVQLTNGKELDSYYVEVNPSSWEAARAIIKARKVVFDPDAVVVPHSPFPT